MNEIRHLGPDASVVCVVRAAREDGYVVRVVPAGADKAESLRLFAEVLDFPPYVGANLDALYDALRSYAARQPMGWALVWDAARQLRTSDPAAYDGIVDVLRDVAAGAPLVRITVLDR